jgi:hypothetical protein
MKEITPKFQDMIPGSWGTHFKIHKKFRRGTAEISHGFAKILFPLWDKSAYLDLEICRIDFPKNKCIQSTGLGHLMYGI